MQFYHTAQYHRCRKFWGSVQLACWLQECPPELLPWIELNFNFSTISRLQRRFREIGCASNRPHNHRLRITTPAQDRHIQHLHLQDCLRPATRTDAATIDLHNQIISAQTIRNRLREAHLHARRPHRGLDLTAVRRRNRLEWSNAHIRWRLALWRGVLFTDESWFSLYREDGRKRVNSLLMSALWIEWPMVAVGLWYGQAYVMDNEHRCILLMEFLMHRDTVMRSWGPLLCHSSTTITSCCSMIMHGPMLQGSVHNSWKLKTSKFLHDQHTHRTCHHWACLGCSGSAYTTVCSSSCQYPATSHSHWRGVDQHPTDHNQQPNQLYVKEMCCTAWGKWWSHQILTGFRTPQWWTKDHSRTVEGSCSSCLCFSCPVSVTRSRCPYLVQRLWHLKKVTKPYGNWRVFFSMESPLRLCSSGNTRMTFQCMCWYRSKRQ